MSGKPLEQHGSLWIRIGAVSTLALVLAACSDSLPSMPRIGDLNPFAEKQQPLPGTRVPVLTGTVDKAELTAADRPVVLPPPVQNESWSQPGGVASNAPGHLQLSAALKTAWTASAGSGSHSRGKLTASPIVYDGKIFTLDAYGRVTAFTTGGASAWRAALAPDKERDAEGFGGGLAGDSGRVYAATGFGTVVALNPKTGQRLWEKNVGAPVRASPTAINDRVFVVTSEGKLWCLNGADGSELWVTRGLPERASIMTNASPAVDGDVVVVPYGSGEVVAISISEGRVLWTESLTRSRAGSQLSSIATAGRPVISGGTVYAVGHSGRMIATRQSSGERVWSLTVPGIEPPAVAGDNIFVVDTRGQVMAVTRPDGKMQWTVKLPAAKTWSGPVLAGNKLWLTASNGLLVSIDATTGKLDSQVNLGQPIYIAPVVAGGRMYVLTDSARLVALN